MKLPETVAFSAGHLAGGVETDEGSCDTGRGSENAPGWVLPDSLRGRNTDRDAHSVILAHSPLKGSLDADELARDLLIIGRSKEDRIALHRIMLIIYRLVRKSGPASGMARTDDSTRRKIVGLKDEYAYIVKLAKDDKDLLKSFESYIKDDIGDTYGKTKEVKDDVKRLYQAAIYLEKSMAEYSKFFKEMDGRFKKVLNLKTIKSANKKKILSQLKNLKQALKDMEKKYSAKYVPIVAQVKKLYKK